MQLSCYDERACLKAAYKVFVLHECAIILESLKDADYANIDNRIGILQEMTDTLLYELRGETVTE